MTGSQTPTPPVGHRKSHRTSDSNTPNRTLIPSENFKSLQLQLGYDSNQTLDSDGSSRTSTLSGPLLLVSRPDFDTLGGTVDPP